MNFFSSYTLLSTRTFVQARLRKHKIKDEAELPQVFTRPLGKRKSGNDAATTEHSLFGSLSLISGSQALVPQQTVAETPVHKFRFQSAQKPRHSFFPPPLSASPPLNFLFTMARAPFGDAVYEPLSLVLSLEYPTSILSFLVPVLDNHQPKRKLKIAPVNAFSPASCSSFDETAGRGMIASAKGYYREQFLLKPQKARAKYERNARVADYRKGDS